ncbi:MAG: hypothetical protein KYX69_21850 [Sphingomonas sp.]|uniref:hypothetical protein n=1 Tax=Sphingomonas sp. TaxID=28214 RepID=UPI00261036BE|nr:hypothetical protein [Sphingomonas sp.]MDK2770352.1 hypothetical protein [Sphingomonas sp.]
MNILILGAHGQIAREATKLFLERTDALLTVYARRVDKLRRTLTLRTFEADSST